MPGAPEDSIRNAYLDIAKRLHPDRLATLDMPKEVVGIAGLLMAKVNVAYRALMDQAQKKQAA
jgi:DnaJ-class molecular chaperone